MDYQRYLRSRAWRATRKRYRESGRPQVCAVCGNPRYELHHLTYARLGRERLDDLQPLCRRHHIAAHTGSNTVRVYQMVDGGEELRGIMQRRYSKKKTPIPNTLPIVKPKQPKKGKIRIPGTLGAGKKRKP